MPEFMLKTVEETPYLYVEKSCSMAPEDISRAMGEAFGEVMGHMRGAGIVPKGPALSAKADMARTGGHVKADVTPAGEVLFFVHKGPYATLRDDYGLMMEHIAAEGLEIGAPTWEVYVNDPDSVPEEDLLTECYVSLA